MKLTALLFLLGASVAAAQDGCKIVSGTTACSCESTYTGEDCSNQDDSCVIPTVAPLSTSSVAELMQAKSSVSANKVSLRIESDATQGRYFNYISLTNGYNANCSYPGINFVKGFEECRDSFVGEFTLPQLVQQCGFTASSLPGEAVFTGSVYVSAVDVLPSLRGHAISRTTKAFRQIELHLPSFVNLTTTALTLYGPIDAQSAITFQEYDPQTDTATVVLTTSVQYPYKLTTPSISVPTDLVPSLALADLECGTKPGDPCIQETTLTFQGLAEGACTLDGDQHLSIEYTCRSAECPVVAGSAINVDLTLESGYLCGTVELTASIDGTFASLDSTFTTPTSVIVAGQTAFFLITVSTDVELSSVALSSVVVTIGQRTVSLGAPLSLSPAGSRANLALDATHTTGSTLGFSFATTYGQDADDIFVSAADAVFTFTVYAELDVTYKTTFGGRKRDIQQATVSFSSSAVLDATKISSNANMGQIKPVDNNNKGSFLGWLFA